MNGATLPVTGTADAITDTATTLKLGCDAADYTGFTPGRIAIVQRGVCAFVDKGHLAQAAGASAIVVVNRDDTDPGALPTFIGASPSFFTIPMIGTDKTAKAALIGADGHTITLAPGGIIANPTYKNTADFSSGGPRDGDSFLKPDVTAPGVSISSAFVGSGTDAQTLSGTSMAAPNTTGVAALVVQAHPTWSPTRIKALIMNTASASPSLIVGYDPRLNGSGVVQPRRAVDSVGIATTGWGEASLSYGYDPRVGDLTDTRTITITNTSKKAITYRLSSCVRGRRPGRGGPVLAPHAPRAGPLEPHRQGDDPAVQVPTWRTCPAPTRSRRRPSSSPKAPSRRPRRPAARAAIRCAFRSSSSRAASRSVSAGAAGHFTVDAGIGSGTIKLNNSGLHSGNADVYAWGHVDPNDGLRETDIRAVGAQSLAGAFGGLPD